MTSLVDGSTLVPDPQTRMGQRLSELMTQADTLAASFRTATPFPHVVIDDFLPPEVADTVLASFPAPESPIWTRLPTEDQRHKLATTDEALIPPPVRAVLLELNSGRFLRFLERITGTPDLIADTKMVGGGLHQILRGGKLSVHVDYSHHPQNGLFRRLNLLIYLTKDWLPAYKGELELWDHNVSGCVAKIAPVFNRCAIFATSHMSYHGHAEPLNFPEGVTRKSLSLYYFTKDPPSGHELIEHNTLFKSRPGDPVHLSNTILRAASSAVVRDWVPPILYRTLRKKWNRRVAGK